MGKGSTRATQRIVREYKDLKGSKEFSNFTIEVGACPLLSQIVSPASVYVWHMSLDILKFEISKDLAADFKAYAESTKRVRS